MVLQLKIKDLLQKDGELYFPSITSRWGILSSPDWALITFLPVKKDSFHFPENFSSIEFVVEVSDEILAFLERNFTICSLAQCFVDLVGALIGHFWLYVHLQKVMDGSLQFCLNKSELLIDLVSQDFSKNCHIVVFGRVVLDPWNNVIGCLKSETLNLRLFTLSPYFWLR